jgi:hypothetical protein
LAQSRKALAEHIKTGFSLPTISSGVMRPLRPRHVTAKEQIVTEVTTPPAPGAIEAAINQALPQ